MAALATTENPSARIDRYMRLASEYDARAQREFDPEIRAELLHTVVQFISLADRTSAAPAERDSVENRNTSLHRNFPCRRSRPRIFFLTRPTVSIPERKFHASMVAPRILKARKGSRPAPHPERGILSCESG